MARTLKLTIAYEGTEFAGWQRQASERTVQAVLEDAFAPIEKGPVTITAAGRTDAGVHAAAQVASVQIHAAIAREDLLRALNAMLPPDLRVLAIDDVPLAFNARRNARRKTYHYWIWSGAAAPPMWRRFAWHLPQPFDLGVMNEGAARLVGTHDFAAFQAAGSEVKTTVRRIESSVVKEVKVEEISASAPGDRLLRYEVTGDGFLRHMVRNIVGTLTDVARGRRAADEIGEILASRDRGRASATAPAHGLVLWRVEY
jgi:tRNA pseudouridine38-40 synthase